MDHNYTVTIIICILSMLTLAIDVGKNTILKKSEIKWFRFSFILAATGAVCEYLGVLFDKTGCAPVQIHWLVTYLEFCVSPCLAVFLARSCGMKKTVIPMLCVMAVNVVIQTVSLANGMIFQIDPDGHFIRGYAYWIYLLFCGISFVYILVVFIVIGIRSKLRNLITILLIASITVTGQIANILNGDINTGYLSICITAILLYIFIQNMFRHMMMEKINREKDISSHDALTRVMSRNSFDRKAAELDRMIQDDPASVRFAVCECDLNNLKLVNDSFGHDSGDSYIINCCKLICDIFKHSPVFRIGGDEFVAILQSDDYDNIEFIKRRVSSTCFDEMTKDAPLPEKKSFAAGFAVFDPKHDSSFATVMKRADTEMYKNKNMLKNL
ncbi:MAG: GGDEF domain-containing protein [Treponema sp.]|nr:GGDEF domain-containing protein [Treponema sp.]